MRKSTTRGRYTAPKETTDTYCAIYLRISDDKKGEAIGVDRQERLCRKLARDKGWKVHDVYRDNDKSAYDLTVIRLDYERMMRDIKAGKVQAIVAYNGDRIHRRLVRLCALLDILKTYEVEVATVIGGNLDLSTAQGRAFAQITGVLAEMESGIKSERITDAMAELAENGAYHGGQRPYGYADDGVKVIEHEADEVRQWAADVLAGKPLRQIAREAAARGALTPTRTRRDGTVIVGKSFDFSNIAQILKRPRVAGLRQYQGEVIGEAAWPALIELDTWHAVRLILEHPDRKHTRHADYLLTGLLWTPEHPDGSCSSDGYCLHPKAKLRGGRKHDGHVRIYTATGAQVNADKTEEAITEAVLRRTDQAHSLPVASKVNASTQAEVARIEAEIAELQQAHDARVINASQLVAGLAPLNRELEAARGALALETAATHVHAPHAWLGQPGALRRLWEAVDDEGQPTYGMDRQREALADLIECVIVMPGSGPGTGNFGNAFDHRRLRYVWRDASTPAVSKAA
jgi:site-specific DNA recombinase